jgi:cell division protein FtsL
LAAIQPALPIRRFGRLVSGRALLAVTAVVALAFAALQVNQVSRVTSTGYAITRLERTRDERQAEVHRLEADVAALSSLARVDWEARTRLGMAPATRRLYIHVNQPVPGPQPLPSRFRPIDERPSGPAGEPWWRRALPFF